MDKDGFIYRTRREVLSYIRKKELLREGDTVIIGLSGGADSMCLFDILLSLREEIEINIKAVHVHHGIRDKSADRDACYVEEVCKNAGIECRIIKIDVPSIALNDSKSIEECAREERYKAFYKEAEKYDKVKIAVAHHIEDQAETVIFRMLRGSGIKGIGGMKPLNGLIIRPLLCIDKSTILSYLSKRGIDYCTDETNYDEKYARNNIRLNIIPKAEEIVPQAAFHIALLAEEAGKVEEFMEEYCLKSYRSVSDPKTKGINAELLSKEKEIVILYVIRMFVRDRIKSLKDITREHINSIYNLIFASGYKEINLPLGYRASRQGKFIIIDKIEDMECEKEDYTFDIPIDIPGSVILPDGRRLLCEKSKLNKDETIPQSLYTKWFDYDKISPGAHLRTPREGDYLIIDDKGTTKSLRRYMIDEKIPRLKRDKLLVAANGNNVHWVIGCRISEDVKITDKTEYIAKLSIVEGDNQNE